jgi:hypothetical protein
MFCGKLKFINTSTARVEPLESYKQLATKRFKWRSELLVYSTAGCRGTFFAVAAFAAFGMWMIGNPMFHMGLNAFAAFAAEYPIPRVALRFIA